MDTITNFWFRFAAFLADWVDSKTKMDGRKVLNAALHCRSIHLDYCYRMFPSNLHRVESAHFAEGLTDGRKERVEDLVLLSGWGSVVSLLKTGSWISVLDCSDPHTFGLILEVFQALGSGRSHLCFSL